MNFIKRHISSILTTIFVIAVVLMFYAPMYAYQEGLQIFMFNGEFFADTCLRPGGLSDYLGCFFVQFFMYPFGAALILAALTVGMQMILRSVFVHNGCNEKTAELLSVVCAVCMVAVEVSYNVMFGGCVAVLIAVAGALLACKIDNKILLAAMTLLVYFAAGGWGCVIYIVALTVKSLQKKDFIFPAINVGLLLFSWLIIKKIMQDDSLYGTFVGVDFNRYPDRGCYVWYVMIIAVIACIGLSKTCSVLGKNVVRLLLYAATTGSLIVYMTINYNTADMIDYRIDRMVRFKQWDNIINTMQRQRSSTYVSQCYLNLALNEHGKLITNMFDFMQLGTEGLVASSINSQDKSICNSEIYFRLGLVNISERLTGEAMESINTFQKSARFYKRLAECAILKGEKELAMRYLKKLQSTIFYRAWAIRAEQFLLDPEHTEALADWKIKPLKMDKDVFYAPSNGAYFIYNLLVNNPNNAKVFNYFVAYLLLNKDLGRLYEFLMQYRPDGDLGVSVYEATLLHLFLHNKDEFNKVMSNNNDLTRRFSEFARFYASNNAQNPQKAKELFGHTYWFYYYYCN